MRKKRFLAITLLSFSFCFVVSGVGYGEEKTVENRREVRVQQASTLDLYLLDSKVRYIMKNPDDFLDITCSYTILDLTSVEGLIYNDLNLPEDFVTKDKLFIIIRDHRGVLSGKTDFDLMGLFAVHLLRFFHGSLLGAFFSYPSGYFYQNVYHFYRL